MIYEGNYPSKCQYQFHPHQHQEFSIFLMGSNQPILSVVMFWQIEDDVGTRLNMFDLLGVAPEFIIRLTIEKKMRPRLGSNQQPLD